MGYEFGNKLSSAAGDSETRAFRLVTHWRWPFSTFSA